jgi:hypothetical protein
MNFIIFTLFACLSAVFSSPAARSTVAAGSGLGSDLGTAIKYVRRTARGAAGNGRGTTIKYLRRIRNGFPGNDKGTTMKYLQKAT